MMDYKRLTKTNANYEEFMERVTGQKMSYLEYAMKVQKGEKVEMSWATLLHMIKMHQRLAELEDKIENGTLIELPCKVGDTVYWVWEEYTNGKQKLSIEEWEVEKICIEKNEWAVKGLGEELAEGVRQFFWCHSSKFGIWWFLTREEAEKKLKELQNG